MIIGCLQKSFILEGQYKTDNKIGLKGIRLQFTLMDQEKNEYSYFINLKKDGSFRIKIKQRGNYLLYVSMVSYPREYWKEPILSNHSDFYTINTKYNGVFRLKDIYISDVIEIISPKENEEIYLNKDFTFEWEKSDLADYYSVSFYVVNQNGQKEPVISVYGIKENTITLYRIRKLKIVRGKIDFNTIVNIGMFKRIKVQLKPGRYGLTVSGYVILPDEKRVIDVTKTSYKNEHYFYIK